MPTAKRPASASARPIARPTAAQAEERAVEAEARLAELDAALVATREELERVSAERDAHKELLQRVAADFDNFRKRQVREREQQALAANERLVLDLLPVFDALELAVDAFDNHEADKVREGVAYVHRALLAALERAGATTIDPYGYAVRSRRARGAARPARSHGRRGRRPAGAPARLPARRPGHPACARRDRHRSGRGSVRTGALPSRSPRSRGARHDDVVRARRGNASRPSRSSPRTGDGRCRWLRSSALVVLGAVCLAFRPTAFVLDERGLEVRRAVRGRRIPASALGRARLAVGARRRAARRLGRAVRLPRAVPDRTTAVASSQRSRRGAPPCSCAAEAPACSLSPADPDGLIRALAGEVA